MMYCTDGGARSKDYPASNEKERKLGCSRHAFVLAERKKTDSYKASFYDLARVYFSSRLCIQAAGSERVSKLILPVVNRPVPSHRQAGASSICSLSTSTPKATATASIHSFEAFLMSTRGRLLISSSTTALFFSTQGTSEGTFM